MKRFFEVLTQNKVTGNVQLSRWYEGDVVIALDPQDNHNQRALGSNKARTLAREWHAMHTHQPVERIEVLSVDMFKA